MKRFLILIGVVTFSLQGYTQRSFATSFEMGFMGGGSYYIGDLNPYKHFIYSKPAFGAIVRYNLTTRTSVRFTGTYGKIWGDDAKSKDAFQQNRNLNFRSNILELAVGFEVDWLKYNINNMKYPVSPYFFYEIAYFRMNPVTDFQGNEVALQSIGTEGQGTSLSDKRKYMLNQISIPIGVGVKFNLRKRLAISIEYGIRKTFTDYMDDVSGNYVDPIALSAANGPMAAALSDRSLDGNELSRAGFNRGNSSTKDWYSFYGIMITFKPFKPNVCKQMHI